MCDEGAARGKVQFDLDAFERRLERQQVIEFSDVKFLIQVVRDERARAERKRENLILAKEVISNTRVVLNRVDSVDEIGDLKTESTILGSQAARVVARLERAELAAAHFYRCPVCGPSEPCPEGWAYVVALGLAKG